MANYFISPAEIKASTYIDENVDDKLITPSIDIAQSLYMLPHLGTGLFDELKTQIGAGNLTALNTTLLGTYIVPAMKYWTLYELVSPMTYKFTNKSVVKKSSENSEPITFTEVTALRDEFKNKAEWLTERLKKYLLENQTDYPLYTNPGTGVDIIHPTRESAFTGGWYLGEDTKNVPDWLKAEYPGTYGTE